MSTTHTIGSLVLDRVHRIETFGTFVQVLESAMADSEHLHVLNVILDPKDRSTAMTRVARRLAKRLSEQSPPPS